jgi:hypothetical protein
MCLRKSETYGLKGKPLGGREISRMKCDVRTLAVCQVQYAVHLKSIWGILTAGVDKVRTSNKAQVGLVTPCAPQSLFLMTNRELDDIPTH